MEGVGENVHRDIKMSFKVSKFHGYLLVICFVSQTLGRSVARQVYMMMRGTFVRGLTPASSVNLFPCILDIPYIEFCC